jgi:uncharacterized membrane protein
MYRTPMDLPSAALLTVHLVATAAMVGLIWFVQVVHYPLFAAVGRAGFADYEAQHQRLTSFVVGPLMAVEGVTALWLAAFPPEGLGRIWPLLGLAVLAVIHASTVFLQVPQHTALSAGFDAGRLHRLVRTNWIRTLGWSARGVLGGAMVVMAAGS